MTCEPVRSAELMVLAADAFHLALTLVPKVPYAPLVTGLNLSNLGSGYPKNTSSPL